MSATGFSALLFPGILLTLIPLALLFLDLTDREASRLGRRIARIAGPGTGSRPVVPPPSRTSVRRVPEGRLRALELLLRRLSPGRGGLHGRLARTGLPLTLAMYLLWTLASGLSILAIFWLAQGVPALFALPGAVAGGLLLPHLTVGLLISRRSARFLQGLPEALDVIVRGLRSGLPVIESIAIVGEEFENPVGTEFKAIADGVRLGLSIEEAVHDCADKLQIREFSFFAISIAIQRETGGNLTETLQNLGKLLRARQQMKLKIRALSAEARASALIVGVLPLAMLLLMQLVNPNYASVFFGDVRGYLMLGAAGTLEVIGALIMVKMVRFKI